MRSTWAASDKPASRTLYQSISKQTSVLREVGPFRFRVPSPEQQVTLATLQRMYRHFYIRFTDILNLTGLVRAEPSRFCAAAHLCAALVDLAGSGDSAEDHFGLQRACGCRRAPPAGVCAALGAFWGQGDLCRRAVLARAHGASGLTTVPAATHRNGRSTTFRRRRSLVSIAGAGGRRICRICASPETTKGSGKAMTPRIGMAERRLSRPGTRSVQPNLQAEPCPQ